MSENTLLFNFSSIFLTLTLKAQISMDCSFAKMSADAKNAISHRGRATAMLLDYLNSI